MAAGMQEHAPQHGCQLPADSGAQPLLCLTTCCWHYTLGCLLQGLLQHTPVLSRCLRVASCICMGLWQLLR